MNEPKIQNYFRFQLRKVLEFEILQRVNRLNQFCELF